MDPTFGANLGLAGNITCYVAQPNGKILVGGTFPGGVARLNANGTRDNSFNPSGGVNPGSEVFAVALVPDANSMADRRVLLYGSFSTFGGAPVQPLVRLTTGGQIDGTFTVDPRLRLTAAGATAQALVFQSGGGTDKVLFAGRFDPALTPIGQTPPAFVTGVGRLNPNGSYDATFTVGAGAVRRRNNASSPLGGEKVKAIVLQNDGKVVVGGYFTQYQGVYAPSLVRLSADGAIDNAPAPAGFHPAAFTTGGNFFELDIQGLDIQRDTDGRILVAGVPTSSTDYPNFVSGLMRLELDGSVDANFGATFGGTLGYGTVSCVTVEPGPAGRIYVGGTDPAYPAARLLADGSADDFILDLQTQFYYQTFAFAVQADGKVLYGAYQPDSGSLRRGNLVRLLPNGSTDFAFALDPTFGPNGRVLGVLIQSVTGEDRLVITGEFSSFNGRTTNGVARLHDDGTLDDDFVLGSGANRRVRAVCAGTGGKILVAGDFSNFNGSFRRGVAQLNASGTLDQAYPPASFTAPWGNAGVSFVALDPQGGHFVGVDLAPSGDFGFYRLNADGSLDATFRTNTQAFVSAVGPAGTRLQDVTGFRLASGQVMIGAYNPAAGAMRYYRFAANGVGDATYTGGNIGGAATAGPRALLQPGGAVLVGVADTRGLLRLTSAGNLDTTLPVHSLAAGTERGIYALGQFNASQVIAGGRFESYGSPSSGSVPTSHVARLAAATGDQDQAYAAGLAVTGGIRLTEVRALAVQADGQVILAGDFTLVNGQVRNYMARLTFDGFLDPGFIPGLGLPNVNGVALQPQDGKIIIGGAFTAAGTGADPAFALARLNPDGSLDGTYDAGLTRGDVVDTLHRNALTGDIVSAGDFAGISARPAPRGGASARRAQRVTAVPRPDRPDASRVGNPIIRNSFGAGGALDSRDLGGTFYSYAGTNGFTHGLVHQADGSIVVAGAFSALNEEPRSNLGRLLPDGDLDPAFIASANAAVRAVTVQSDGKIVIGGDFTQVNGQVRSRVARLNPDGTLDMNFNVSANGAVTSIKMQPDGRILLGGDFTQLTDPTTGNVNRGGLARLNRNGTIDTSMISSPLTTKAPSGTQVRSIEVQPDGKFIVGGAFDAIQGFDRPNVTRLMPDGSVDGDYDPGFGPDKLVRALHLQPDGRALLGGDFTRVDETARTAAARLLGDNAASSGGGGGYFAWRLANFGTTENAGIAGDEAIPFGDGVPNLAKFAFNLDPSKADFALMAPGGSRGLPLLGRDGSGRLTLTFVRRKSNTVPGISYVPEFANGLAAGFASNPVAIENVQSIDASFERVIVTDSITPGPASPALRG